MLHGGGRLRNGIASHTRLTADRSVDGFNHAEMPEVVRDAGYGKLLYSNAPPEGTPCVSPCFPIMWVQRNGHVGSCYNSPVAAVS